MDAPLTPKGYRFSELVIEIFRQNGALLAAGDALCAPLGLTSARWQVMGVLEHGPAPIAQIARTMGLTRQSVRETAAALVRDGLAELAPNPNHRTAQLLQQTPRGAAVMRKVTGAHTRWANGVAAQLSAGELDVALDVLRRIGGIVAEGDDKDKPERASRRLRAKPRPAPKGP